MLGCSQGTKRILWLPTQTVDNIVSNDQTSAFSSCLHISQHTPLINIGIVSLHTCVAPASIKTSRNIDHVCNNTKMGLQKDISSTRLYFDIILYMTFDIQYVYWSLTPTDLDSSVFLWKKRFLFMGALNVYPMMLPENRKPLGIAFREHLGLQYKELNKLSHTLPVNSLLYWQMWKTFVISRR